MDRFLGALKLATAAAVVAGGLFAATASALEEGKLVIWVGGDKAYDGIQAVGDRFTKDTGIPVTVEHPEDVTGKFQQAAASGKGPDIFFWAHDRLGEWVNGGLVAPVTPSDRIKDDVAQTGWNAFTIDGRIYGYPISFEAVGLIYNKDLVSTPPKTFQDVIALDKKLRKDGKHAILWDYNNTYFTWPLLAANGGYVFKQSDDGAYDTGDTGVNNAGSVKGVKMVKRLIDEGVMPEGATYADMESGVNKGTIAMMINGPWSWANLRKSGINFGVTTIPSIDGHEGKPFVGVWGAMISAASPNKDLAKEFMESYLMTEQGLTTVDNDVTIGTPASKSFFKKVSDNPDIKATMANVQLGEPMPNVPEMGRFWSAMASALQNITSGRQGVEEGLNAAAARIEKK